MGITLSQISQFIKPEKLKAAWQTSDSTQKMMAIGGAADMVLGDRSWIDIALNTAGMASLFYQPLILPVAIGYGIRAAMYLVGDPTKLLTQGFGGFMKSGVAGCLLTLDFGGAFKNLVAAGFTAICAIPFARVKELKAAWSAATAGKMTKAAFAEEAIGTLYGKEILGRYQTASTAFKAKESEGVLSQLWEGAEAYFKKSNPAGQRQLQFNFVDA